MALPHIFATQSSPVNASKLDANFSYLEGLGIITPPGLVGDGVALDATALNIAISAGGAFWIPPGTYYLGTTALQIPANTELRCAKGAVFTVDSSTPASMPQAYLSINGSNVTIDGAKGYIAANPFSTYAAKGSFIGFGASSISNIKINNCDSTWFMHHVFGSHIATTVANSVSNVEILHNRSTCFANDIYYTGKSAKNWIIDGNKMDGTRAIPSNNAGAIGIYCAVDIANINNFTQTNYDSDCGVGITVTNNQIENVRDRPIRLINCKQLQVYGNKLTLSIGSYFLPAPGEEHAGDAITFDLCRQLQCHGNTIYGGGENGIDLLSCQDYEVYGNTIKQCNTTGIYVHLSDLWNSSGTSPKLSSITARESLQNRNGDIYDNYAEAWNPISVSAGQHVSIHDNKISLFKTSTYWVTGTSPVMIALDNSACAAYFAESTAYRQNNVTIRDNQPVLVGPVSVTADAGTDTFTTVGGVSHNFVTGDLVESIAGGSSLTVDYPAGLDYKVDYYVIKTSATAFKLATSWNNAFASTAVNITTNGLTVSNSELLFRQLPPLSYPDVSATHYTPAQNIALDENMPGYRSVNLFSTLSTIVPGSAFMFTKHKHQYIYDPAVNYGIARNTIGKYFDIPQLASNGTVVFGIQDYGIGSGGYTFSVGAKPANMVGTPTDGYIKTTFW